MNWLKLYFDSYPILDPLLAPYRYIVKYHLTTYLYKHYFGMATVFLTNFIRCRTSFRMLFRLSLTMSLLGCDDLRQELTVKVRLPR
ncbi:hypothetical protein E3T57_08855 [Enterococcus faecium]|nr:hypothetical protein BTN90_02050 [Enterococcus faecium]RRQ55210.1 hypothetical protein CUR41_04375 [Enterococcus faecium]UXD34210.1 hypothetical protein E3O58_01050 [Enterococcus faecium]UXD44644.1 hypothetical protein E3T57_08855 [Enterococcus faecium]